MNSIIVEENTDSVKIVVIEDANNSKTFTDITEETGTGKANWKQPQFIKQGKDCFILSWLDMFLAGYMVLENEESYQFVLE